MNPKCLLLLLAVCLLIGGVQAWGAGMGAWEYRKEITINNTGSNLTNYQMMFTVNRSSGTDSGSTVYLNGKCQEDYDDIRFTTSDGNTLCDYWIESSSSTVAQIWVEIPSIVNSTAYGSTKVYLYYRNAGASAVSNGYNTFIFFDDFTGSSLDGAKWTQSGGTLTVSDSVMNLSSTDSLGRVISVSTFSDPVIFRSKVKPKYIGGTYTIFQRLFDAGSRRITCTYADAGSYPSKYRVYDSAESTANILGDTADTWHIQEVRWIASNSVKFYVNDANYVTITSNVPTVDMSLDLGAEGSKGSSANICCDWIFTREYTATEPTVSAWGSEEDRTVRYLTVDFSGVPTSGYVPLTVYFTDASIGYNVTLDTWAWSFGDNSPNSTQQNPAHTYTTSGLYNVILTVTNTSFSKTNSTTKFAYINVTTNLDAPNADFTVTETCGETTDTFYFIDYSTGGGLYQWNWSFGDGSYSELRNPTHQYSSNGTYDVGLTVWGAYGNDTLTRSNLITIPCGAATPTPTPTPTPTGTGGAVTEGNVTYILAPDQDYVPFPIWLAIVIVSIALFGHSIIFLRNSDLTAMMSAVFAFISAWLSNMIGYIDVQITSYAEEIVISPVIQAAHPPWLVYTMLIFAFVSLVNIFAAIYKVYIKPVPWNEIYDRKLPRWQNRR